MKLEWNNEETDLGYEYPDGLDLRPSSELHKELVSDIVAKAKRGLLVVAEKAPIWEKIEQTLTGYVRLDSDEQRIKSADDRKPVRIVIPMQYAIRETLLTYMTAAFLGESPLIGYEGIGPEDQIPAALLEMLIEWQLKRAKAGMAFHTMWSDAFTYGYGVLAPSWKREMSKRTIVKPKGFWSLFSGLFTTTGYDKEFEEIVGYEGHKFENIAPQLFIPDPNTAIHNVQESEFVGWVQRTNIYDLLRREQEPDSGIFNVRYGNNKEMSSSLFESQQTGTYLSNQKIGSQGYTDDTKKADVIWMYRWIIPHDHKLGESKQPEKWLFAVLGEKILIAASKLNLNHGKFPVVTYAPETTGRDVTPISKLEISYGIQEAVNWYFASHFANVRKALNNYLVADPGIINMADLYDPKPGGVIRTRQQYYGRGIGDSLRQLNVTNVTGAHMSDAMMLMGIGKETTGATDMVQGIMRMSGERRSATEASGARSGAISRLEMAARLFSIQTLQDLAEILGSQTQQFMSVETSLRVIGRRADELREEHGFEGSARISPFDVLCEYDVSPRDGTIPNRDDAQNLLGLLNIVATNPQLQGVTNSLNIVKAIARRSGEKSFNDFIRKNNVQFETMPTEQVLAESARGNMMPVQDQEYGYE